MNSNKLATIYASLAYGIKDIISQACGSAVPYITKPMLDSYRVINASEKLNSEFKALIILKHKLGKTVEKLNNIKHFFLSKHF